MIVEKRKLTRVEIDLPVNLVLRKGNLVLRKGENGPLVAGPVPGTLNNVTPFGAGLTVEHVFVDNHHLFYSPEENPEIMLYLEIPLSGESDENLSIPVKPIWFDTVDSEESTSFYIGIEFLVPPENDQLRQFNEMIKGEPGHNSKLFRDFFLKLWSRMKNK